MSEIFNLVPPFLIGHRGAAASAPENTLTSLAEAARQGVRWVEIDVALTADGVPVILHDERLERTTDGQGALADTAWAALSRLDAGAWFDPRFAGERVPTLEHALAAAAALGLGLNLEIKPTPGRAVATAQGVVETLARLAPPCPILVSSFALECLEVARDRAPTIPRGLLLGWRRAGWRRNADRLEVATLHVTATGLTARAVADFRLSGRPVLVYTVNDPKRARKLFGWGVTAVFTDAPARLAAELAGDAGQL